MIRALKNMIRDSIALKLMTSVTIVIALIMIISTAFVARMITDWQYRTLEARSRELKVFLGRAVTDAIIMKDIKMIDSLVSEAVKSQDMIYAVVIDEKGAILSTKQASFNRTFPMIKEILEREKADDVGILIKKINERVDILELAEDIFLPGTKIKIGSVKFGFSKASVRQNARKIVWLLLGTSIGTVAILSVVVYIMVKRMIAGPAAEAVAVASNVASGDLSLSVKVRTNDELGTLGRGLNAMIIGLKNMIMKIQEAGKSLGGVSTRLKEISESITSGSRDQTEVVEDVASSVNEMHFALKEIGGNIQDAYTTSEHTSSTILQMAASIDEVAKTMSELSASIEETTTTVTQMSAAIKQTAENIETLSAAAEETAASATQISISVREVESNAKESAALAEAVAEDGQKLGMSSIEKTIEGMRRIEDAARRTADVVNRLMERSESIGTILTVIEDITDQTALLALNASILAAQAGEHGRGFAVVASEIRELANRTAASTQEIGKIISTVQEETREAAELMKQGLSVVEQGTRLSTDAGEAIKKILERANQSKDMSKSISRAAQEQSRGISQVREAVERINEMTHQIARATREQRSGSEQIIRAAEKMREITRFVKTATAEQAKGSKDITRAVETMSSKMGMVNRAATEVQTGSDLIVKAIERIKAIAKANGELAAGLNSAVVVLSEQAETLHKSIEKFRME